MLAVHDLEVHRGALLAIKQLQHGNSGQVLLQKRIDVGHRHADASVAGGNGAPEKDGDYEHQRHHGQHHESESDAQAEHGGEDKNQNQHVAKNSNQSRGEHLVERIGIGGDAGHEPADWRAVVESDVEVLEMRHHATPQLKHGVLARALHQVLLAEID